jgi:hypothetical protein
MKRIVDWDKIEEETRSEEETCECTRSKLQSLIDFVMDLLPKKKESSCCAETDENEKGQCNDN